MGAVSWILRAGDGFLHGRAFVGGVALEAGDSGYVTTARTHTGEWRTLRPLANGPSNLWFFILPSSAARNYTDLRPIVGTRTEGTGWRWMVQK
jgi:hypothetical protein